jgi:Uma2 family endonuclease
MRVKTTPTRYTYPDVVVVCEEPKFEDGELDTLLNPTVIVEVLSPSTKARDRGEKFFEYRALPSVKDYLVISQDTMHVEHYTRQSGDEWMLHDVTAPEVTIRIPSIGCELSLAEVYERVQFAQP